MLFLLLLIITSFMLHYFVNLFVTYYTNTYL